MAIRTNGELGRELKGQSSARFCLCDFHVHSRVLSASLHDAWGLSGYAQHLDPKVDDSEWDRKSHPRWCRR